MAQELVELDACQLDLVLYDSANEMQNPVDLAEVPDSVIVLAEDYENVDEDHETQRWKE